MGMYEGGHWLGTPDAPFEKAKQDNCCVAYFGPFYLFLRRQLIQVPFYNNNNTNNNNYDNNYNNNTNTHHSN